jgi:hypothetical protein
MNATMSEIPAEILRGVEREIEPRLQIAESALTEMDERLLTFAKARPVAAIGAALVAGFVLGKLTARV